MNARNCHGGRRAFFKKSVAGLLGVGVAPSLVFAEERSANEEQKAKRALVCRALGKTGISLPIVSMGVMNADNPSLVSAALDAGIVMLDTAHVYQRGRNEEMIAEVIKGRPRDSFVLATKVAGDGLDRKTGLFTERTEAAPFVEKFEISLQRLGLEYVDILYMHSVVTGKAALFEPLVTAMSRLKKAGKVRFIGVSTHRNEPEVIRTAAESGVYDIVLTAYNFRQPHVADVRSAIEFAAVSGLGVVAMKTQAGGYWDRERRNPINMKAALKWVLKDKNVHTAIPGFTTFDQMELDLSVMADLDLTPEEKYDLNLGDRIGQLGLFCPQCGKCVDMCRDKLDIPSLMRAYMYTYGYKNLGAAHAAVQMAGLDPISCDTCNRCAVDCTMGFDIKKRLLDITRIRTLPEDFLV